MCTFSIVYLRFLRAIETDSKIKVVNENVLCVFGAKMLLSNSVTPVSAERALINDAHATDI